MSSVFVIRRAGVTECFQGRHMEDLTLAIFARGPEYATVQARDLPRATEAAFTSSGFLIDHDARRGVVIHEGACFYAEDARVNGWQIGTLPYVATLRQLDLWSDEEEALVEVMRAGVTKVAWIQALQRMPGSDSWRDWSVAWGAPESFALEAFPTPAVEPEHAGRGFIATLEQAFLVSPESARALDFALLITIEGDGGGAWLVDCTDRPGVRVSNGESAPSSITLTAADAALAVRSTRDLLKLHLRGRLRLGGDPLVLPNLVALLALGQ